ncbi:MAG: hypothetical protein R3190_12710 [Thermoanaerobaculia bacterium]|nr:hypothetical protein [Thermoanaerobaculia bacterium]
MKLENAVGAVAVLLAIGAVPAATAAEIPRLPNGKPDFSGNYNAATLTPLTRPAELGDRLTLTDEEAAAIAKRKADLYAADSAPSDPDRGAPPVGGTPIFDPGLEVASGGSGGYNAFYMDPGEGAFKIDGKWRTSILVDPADGQLPALTPAAQQRQAVAAKLLRANVETGEAWWIGDDSGGPYDDMEQRPHAERCLLGFGSTAGPPMLPTLYNSMKTIVHTEDHLMILIEMAHDARIIRIGGEHLPSTIKTWLGDSIAKWEGDTLVVETTNQRNGFRQFGHKLADAPEGMRIVERFSYLNPETLLYQFTVSEPSSFTAPFSGEYVWPASDDRVYEYACHEGNYALGNIMRGARMLEADTRPAGESGR